MLVVFFLLFFTLSTVSIDPVWSHGPIYYRRDQLSALCNTAVLPEERPNVPRELGGIVLELSIWEEKRYRPMLPPIIMGNVRSLPNKMDELLALTRHESDMANNTGHSKEEEGWQCL